MDRKRAAPRARTRPRSNRAITINVSPRTLWTIAGITLLLLALILVLVKGLDVLLLLYIAIVIAEGIRPIVDWLDARHVPRPLAVLAIYLVALAVVVGVGWLLLQPLIDQIVGLVNDFPHYAAQARQVIAEIESNIGQSPVLQQAINAAQGTLGNTVGGVISAIIRLPFTLSQLLVDAVVILVITFFWLTGIERLRPFFVSLFPLRSQSDVQGILSEIGEKTGGYLRGVAIDAVVVGILSGLADWLIGAPYPLILGAVAALTELIPYFGPWLSGILAALLTALSGQVITALIVVVAYIVIQQVEGHVLIPYVMMRVVEVNPLTVVIATLLGFALLGVIGAVLAVPTASIIHVLVVRLTAPMIRKHTQRAEESADAGEDEGGGEDEIEHATRRNGHNE